MVQEKGREIGGIFADSGISRVKKDVRNLLFS